MVPRLWNLPLRDTGIQAHGDEGRRLFGLDPAGYLAGRPEYPEAVYEALVQRCGLGPTARVLEIGPGTGLLTRHLLRQGARVTAIEPDRSMAPYLSDTAASANLDVVIASFEEADITQEKFDLAVAATSFHWVDQEVGLSKLGQVLRLGGWVALWWTFFRDPDQPDEFSRALDHILGPLTRGAFDEPGRPPFQLDESHRRRDMTRWAGLDDVTSQVIPWTCEITPVQARALYASMGTVIRHRPTSSAGLWIVSNGSPPRCPMASLENGSCPPSTFVRDPEGIPALLPGTTERSWSEGPKKYIRYVAAVG
jgi:SAM-dependent methyltransferase